MKTVYCVVIIFLLGLISCQKPIDDITIQGDPQDDSLTVTGDTITYEVISTDTSGWFGMWMDENSRLISNKLDSVSYGSPIYFHSGWRYSFVPKTQPFQALISVANWLYTNSITVNLYKGGQLIKTSTNDAMDGVAKLMVDIDTTLTTGTTAKPVLTYEVLVSDADTSAFESDSWLGGWTMPDGVSNQMSGDVSNPLLYLFAIPSGWHYSFVPDHLPFDMFVFAGPYIENSSNVTINFYVNNQLVKSASSRKLQRLTYTVQ